jgi:hypothetical protein
MSIVIVLLSEVDGQIRWAPTSQDSAQGSASRHCLRPSGFHDVERSRLQRNVI